MFHGSNKVSGRSILKTGLTMDLVGENKVSAKNVPMFGPGVYLAECSSKADEYAHDGPEPDGTYAMIVCRAVLGKVFVTPTPGDFTEKVTKEDFDSVLGDRKSAVGTYREFVLYDGNAIYPEYIVLYKRVCNTVNAPGSRETVQADGRDDQGAHYSAGGALEQRLRGQVGDTAAPRMRARSSSMRRTGETARSEADTRNNGRSTSVGRRVRFG